MKSDLTTKLLLGVIAFALLLNAATPYLRPTIAHAAPGDPLDDIADELEALRRNVDDIKLNGLKVRGVSSYDIPVKSN